MASTASGWQYAVPTDTLVAWPAVSQAVADKLEIVAGGKNVGLAPISTSTFTAQATVTIDSVFSSSYDNYLIQISGTSTATQNLRAVFRTSAPADVITNYTTGSVYTNAGAGPFRSSAISGSVFLLPAIGQSNSSFTINIKDVALAKPTAADYTSFAVFSTEIETAIGGCVNTNSAAYTGIKFYVATGTFTATIRIYGLRNS